MHAKVRHHDADWGHGVQGKGFHNLSLYFLSWLGLLQQPQQPHLLATAVLAALSTLRALADAMNLNQVLLQRASSMPASRFGECRHWMAAVGVTKLHVSANGVQRGCRLQDARMMRHYCQIVAEVWGLMPLVPFCVPCLDLALRSLRQLSSAVAILAQALSA